MHAYFTIALLFLSSFIIDAQAANQLDSPDEYSAFAAWKDLSAEEYQAKLDEFVNRGFRPIDFEVRSVNKKRRYSLIMRKNDSGDSFILKSALSDRQFKKHWTRNKNKGYRLIDQEAYVHRGDTYYGGLWVKDGEKNWKSFRNLSSKKFSEIYQENKSKYMLIDIDVFVRKGKTYFSGIYVNNREKLDWAVYRNLSSDNFAKKFKELSDKGFRLLDIDSYKPEKSRMFMGLWVKDKNDDRSWRANRNMTATDFRNRWNRYTDLGYRIEDVDTYVENGKRMYSAIWVENVTSRTKWKHRNAVSKLVEEYLDDNPAEGFSLAIWQNGQTRYMRGWGNQNRDEGVWAHADTIYRIASVSKGVTGVLAYILQEDNEIDLDDDIRDFLRLSRDHNYSVKELLNIRSGVCHYDTCGNHNGLKIDLDDDDSMWPAVKKMRSADLETRGTLLYSTHGYTFAAAAFEDETNQPFNKLLTDYINSKIGTRLVCEDLDKKHNERSQIFFVDDDSKIKKASALNYKWKCAGGGMEASVNDLIKLGTALIDNTLMKRATLDDMISAPDNQTWGGVPYAQGWGTQVKSDGSVDWFAKAGDQTGGRSYLRVYLNDNIVIALSGNTRGSNYQALTTSIKDVIANKPRRAR